MAAPLRDGSLRFGVLRPGERPRADERPVRFGGEAEAARFLARLATDGGADALRGLLAGYAAARLRTDEVPRALAPRFASGELRLVEVRATERLFLGFDEFALLGRSDPPRPGETLRAFWSAEQAEHFLRRMWDDPRGRRPLRDALRRHLGSVHPDGPHTDLRAFATRLAAGSVRVVRIAPFIAPPPSGAHTVEAARVPLADNAPPAQDAGTAVAPEARPPLPLLPGAVPCGDAWAAVNLETLRILNEGGDADLVERNRHISATYASLYQRRPELRWSGLAAITSTNAGCAMREAREMADAWRPGFAGPDDAAVAYRGLADTNELVFAEIYPVMRFYDRFGMEGVRKCGAARPPEPLSARSDRVRPPPHRGIPRGLARALESVSRGGSGVRRGANRIAVHEQVDMVQNQIYTDATVRDAFERNQWWSERRLGRLAGARPIEIRLSDQCTGPGRVIRMDGDITNAQDRVTFYHKLMDVFERSPRGEIDRIVGGIVRNGAPGRR